MSLDQSTEGKIGEIPAQYHSGFLGESLGFPFRGFWMGIIFEFLPNPPQTLLNGLWPLVFEFIILREKKARSYIWGGEGVFNRSTVGTDRGDTLEVPDELLHLELALPPGLLLRGRNILAEWPLVPSYFPCRWPRSCRWTKLQFNLG